MISSCSSWRSRDAATRGWSSEMSSSMVIPPAVCLIKRGALIRGGSAGVSLWPDSCNSLGSAEVISVVRPDSCRYLWEGYTVGSSEAVVPQKESFRASHASEVSALCHLTDYELCNYGATRRCQRAVVPVSLCVLADL